MKPTDDVAPWIERLARVGYTAKGILYITIGYLAAKAGLGQGGSVTDTGGAMRQVKHASLGQPLRASRARAMRQQQAKGV